MPNTTLRPTWPNHSATPEPPRLGQRPSCRLNGLLLVATLATVARAQAATPAAAPAKSPPAKSENETPAAPAKSAVPGKAATRSSARSSAAARSQTPDELLKITTEIFPEDAALTASILNKYLDCRVLRAQHEATLAAERARKEIAAANEQLKEDIATANARAKKAQNDANRAKDEAKSAADRALESAFADYAAQPRFKVATTTVTLPTVLRDVAPVLEVPRIEMTPMVAVYDDGMIPPKRSLPAKEIIHPFDMKATVARLVELSLWDKIVNAWPGGCQP
jgi:hypothetical protein